jgi:hypothetical protein
MKALRDLAAKEKRFRRAKKAGGILERERPGRCKSACEMPEAELSWEGLCGIREKPP